MQLDPLDLIRALHSRVLLCDEEGRILETLGGGGAANVFAEPLLRRLRQPLEEALAGTPFEATLPSENGGTVRVRLVPVQTGGPVRLLVAFEPEVQSTDRLRSGSLDSSEVAFLIRHLRQGLWRLDAEGIVLEANEYLAAWLETTIGGLVGTPASRWRAVPEISSRYEVEFVSASGLRKRGLVMRSDVVSPTGAPLGALELVTDVTAEHALKSKLVEEVRRMSRLARTDSLTGLPNRMVFDERLRELQAEGSPFAVVLVDLDDLKLINDERGHASGDQALVEIGNRLRDTLRGTDLVARIGGDEFAALLPNTDPEAADAILVRLQERLESDDFVRASVGLAHSEDGVGDVAKAADEAMYRHKRARKAEG